MVDLLGPFILSKPIGHDKVPMFFWGPLNGPGVAKKKEGCFATQPPILFFLNVLDPDGCLVADQLKAYTKIREITGADNKKDFLLNWIWPCKKK
jgi:hypothetical protein